MTNLLATADTEITALRDEHEREVNACTTAISQKSKDGFIQLMPAGKFSAKDGRGPWTVGDVETMQAIVERTNEHHGSNEVVIDYEHQTIHSESNGKPAPASGWIKELVVRPSGIYAKVEWTTNAKVAIQAGEYRYISPVFHSLKTKSGPKPVYVILNAALTNFPALDIEQVMARANSSKTKESKMDKKLLELLGLKSNATQKSINQAVEVLKNTVSAIAEAAGFDTDSDDDPADFVISLKSDRDALIEAMGLDDDVETDVAVTALKATMKQAATNTEKLKGKTNPENPDPAQYVPAEELAKLQKDFVTLKASIGADQAEATVGQSIKEGRLPPALKDWGINLCKSDPDAFAEYVGGAPVLTAEQLTSEKKAKGKGTLSATELQVCAQMGVDEAEFLKSKSEMGDAEA